MEEDLRALRKAELIIGGPVTIPKDFKVPVRISRSTAGPGAGNQAIVFSFDGMRVKKQITRGGGDFELTCGETMTITKNGEIVADDVMIEPVAFHCPEQAFFNLDQNCIFDCAYCSSPLLKKDATKGLDGEKIINMIRECKEPIYSVAITSGVAGSVESTIDRMIDCVVKIKKEFPELPIGVEPYIDQKSQIDRLFEAGAEEIKINCEASRKDIFQKVCPKLDYDNIFEMLAHSVSVFGKGHVATNVIVGLGESDDDIVSLMGDLASKGIVPGLRCLRVGPMVIEQCRKAIGEPERPTPERLLKLAKEQKRILEEHGLDTRTFETMCFKCTCCDLVPFRDL